MSIWRFMFANYNLCVYLFRFIRTKFAVINIFWCKFSDRMFIWLVLVGICLVEIDYIQTNERRKKTEFIATAIVYEKSVCKEIDEWKSIYLFSHILSAFRWDFQPAFRIKKSSTFIGHSSNIFRTKWFLKKMYFELRHEQLLGCDWAVLVSITHFVFAHSNVRDTTCWAGTHKTIVQENTEHVWTIAFPIAGGT